MQSIPFHWLSKKSRWLLLSLVLGACGDSRSSSAGETVSFEEMEPSVLPMDPSRGKSFRRDEGFLLEGHTVPTLLRHKSHYWMFSSAPMRGQIALHRSVDGVNWESLAPMPLAQFSPECGRSYLDVAARSVGDRMEVWTEGWVSERGLTDPSGQQRPQEESPTLFCVFSSEDGQAWERLSSPVPWEDDRSTWPSGLDFVPGGAGVFYVDTHPELDGIRRAQVHQPPRVQAQDPATLLPRTHVDPNPVALLGGGLRLYHSLALEGALAYSDSSDGSVFSESMGLGGLSGQTCFSPPERPSPPDACYLDPSVVVLQDGRIAVYFSLFETTDSGQERKGIGRAWALD
jgi:hypothetical protein